MGLVHKEGRIRDIFIHTRFRLDFQLAFMINDANKFFLFNLMI